MGWGEKGNQHPTNEHTESIKTAASALKNKTQV